ncbi:uncharacterized protein TNCV_1691181 [Trichonephila clavipes]|nr:uncharacterized protein TNCV_1691181 [Trichonephila clavipes]
MKYVVQGLEFVEGQRKNLYEEILLSFLMPPDRQRPDQGPRNSSWLSSVTPVVSRSIEHHTVNGDRYRAMITNFFIPELNNHDVQELWFQQDGATCPTARATIDLLKDTLGDRLISRFGPVNWPPRSCDLTPLDYFLGAM